jgi:hypothetical protein
MDKNVRRMLKGMGLKNGTAFIQSLPCDGKIYFHEMGYRLSGGMIFKLTEPLVNINDMKIMLRLAVGGEPVTEREAAGIDLSCGGKVGCQLMCPLDVGTIEKIEGVDEIRTDPSVVDFIQYYNVGDTITEKNIGTLGQHFCRITFILDSEDKVAEKINEFQSKLRIYAVGGKRMNNLPFSADRMTK